MKPAGLALAFVSIFGAVLLDAGLTSPSASVGVTFDLRLDDRVRDWEQAASGVDENWVADSSGVAKEPVRLTQTDTLSSDGVTSSSEEDTVYVDQFD